jgi:hypothetical protein
MQDDGYSNYTVEETYLECLMDKHPLLPATATYHDEELKEVECDAFLEGEPAHIDVDTEQAVGGYGLPDHERLLPYFHNDLVRAVVKLKQWSRR